MIGKPLQFHSSTQRLARGFLIAACGVLSLGLLGAVSVRGGSSDQQVIHVQPESAMLVATQDIDATADNMLPTQPVETAQPTKHIRLVRMLVTAYCPCTICCGPKAQGITASGKPVSFNGGHFVAADPGVPFGTHLIIPGYGNDQPVPVIDRGGAIKGNRLDVYFPTHQEALNWGRQWVTVTVID